MTKRGTEGLSDLPIVAQLRSNAAGTWAQTVCLWRKYQKPQAISPNWLRLGNLSLLFLALRASAPHERARTNDISALGLYSMLVALLWYCPLGKMKQLSQFHSFPQDHAQWAVGPRGSSFLAWVPCPSALLIVKLPITFMACKVEKEKQYRTYFCEEKYFITVCISRHRQDVYTHMHTMFTQKHTRVETHR